MWLCRPQPYGLSTRASWREYAGVYQWEPNAFAYVQTWDEFSGFGKPPQPVAFDESGEICTLYRMDRDRFFAGHR
jgi:hypothetical protein